MDPVAVVSEIPATLPSKRVIENAARDAFRGLMGPWTVTIRVARGGSWWLLRAEGPGFDRTLIVDPPEQKPPIIQARLRELLRDAGVVEVAEHAAATTVDEDHSLMDLFDAWLPQDRTSTPNAS